MANKHAITDSRGQVHKRTSLGRVYTHCVVIHFKALPAEPEKGWVHPRSAYSRAEWASNAALAEKNAASWRGKSHVDAVEIIPVGGAR
jgi:hypothetical protein